MKKILKWLFAILCIAFAGISGYLVFKIGVLPSKYVWLLEGGILLFLLMILFLLFFRKRWVTMLGIVLGVLFLIGNGTAIYYLRQTDYFLSKAFSGRVVEKTDYYLVTLKRNEGEFNEKSNVIYYDKIYQKNTILSLLNENYHFTFTEYDSMNTMIDDVLEGKERYILIEATSYHILEQFDTRVSENFVILKSFSIEHERKTKEINEQSMNIYILGNDFVGLNDFNMIVTVNKAKKRVLLTTITRDFRVPVYGYDGIEDNLEYLAPLGIETSIHSLEDYFDITIDYYVRVNVDSVVEVVNAVGGITYCSDYDYYTTTTNAHNKNGRKFHVVKGCQEVDGYQALAIARERKKIPGSDFARQENCRKILLAIFQKVKSTDSLKNYPALLDSLSDSYETTIPRSLIEEVAQDILKENSKWTIEEYSLGGEEVIGLVHLGTYRDYTVIPNLDSVEIAKEKMHHLGKD